MINFYSYNQFHKSQRASVDTVSCLNGNKLEQFDFRFSEKTPEAARRRPTTHRDVINSLETGSVIWCEYVLFYPQGSMVFPRQFIVRPMHSRSLESSLSTNSTDVTPCQMAFVIWTKPVCRLPSAITSLFTRSVAGHYRSADTRVPQHLRESYAFIYISPAVSF
jgi:hypothetical protein